MLGMDINSTLQQLKALIAEELRPQIAAELRAELRAELERDAAFIGKRLIDTDMLEKKLGWSRSTIERKLRSDPRFPKPKRFFGQTNKPQWELSAIDDYIDNGPN